MYTKAVVVALCFIAADFVTGLFQALCTKSFKSSVMRQGLVHKTTEMLIVALAYAVEVALPMLGMTVEVPLVLPVICYIVAMEIGSIIENLCKLNPDMRKVADKYLDKYEKKEGEE